jgi:dihydroorotate dehydrogenase (NAD+) catalytic subunit
VATVIDFRTTLGPVELRTPLIGAAGTVGSVVDFAGVADLSLYGAAVAKSVSEEPWEGRPAPRLAPSGLGMLNSIGIQNPGIEDWVEQVGPHLADLDVPVWGSAVGKTAAEFGRVAAGLERAGVQAIEINLSCPNLEGHGMFALDRDATGAAVDAVRQTVGLPIGAKLSPNAEDIGAISAAAVAAGADWLVLTNTVWGAGIDVRTRRPLLSGLIGGYSGPPLKPIALRCVLETRRALPEVPIIGCGGVTGGADVVEFLLAGASAVCVGTAHFDRPRIAGKILEEVRLLMAEHEMTSIRDYIGAVQPW